MTSSGTKSRRSLGEVRASMSSSRASRTMAKRRSNLATDAPVRGCFERSGEHVRAVYRKGIGTEGLLEAGQLTRC